MATKIKNLCGTCARIADGNPFEPHVNSAKFEVTIFEGTALDGPKRHRFLCQRHFTRALNLLPINSATLVTITRLR